MPETTHTPPPWILDESLGGSIGLWPKNDDERPIARFLHGEDVGRTKEEAEAHARFVLKAVACHDPFKQALRRFVDTWGSEDEDAILRARDLAKVALLMDFVHDHPEAP